MTRFLIGSTLSCVLLLTEATPGNAQQTDSAGARHSWAIYAGFD